MIRYVAPFNLAFRTTKPYFDWLEEKENATRFKRFGKAMTGTGGWEVTGAILEGQNSLCLSVNDELNFSLYLFKVSLGPICPRGQS